MGDNVIDAAELPPFTTDQVRALGECRWVGLNLAHSHVIAHTADRALADAVGVSTTAWHPDPREDPERVDYELNTSHPVAIEAAQRIIREREAVSPAKGKEG